MSTPRTQRVGIWIIAVVLTLGTFGSFIAMALSIPNQKIDQAEQQKQIAEYQKQQKEAALARAAQAEPLTGYESRTFDKSGVSEINVEVLREGNGKVINATDTINVSYFGWTSDGKLFDSSKKKGEADKPITISLSGVIQGWTDGLTGQKEGSIVRLTIPADKGYGPIDSGAIPANSPLEFIVEIHKIENTKS